MVVINCATGTIDEYVPSAERPWNETRAKHLYRRLGFGGNQAQIEAALSQSPTDLVDALIDEAITMPFTDEPEWANWTFADYGGTQEAFFEQQSEQFVEWVIAWVKDMHDKGFREKLSLFWHNHFVTRAEAYICPSHMFRYHRLLQQYALGNFKEFVSEIGLTPAMLVFLNGVENSYVSPNENYARELYELFTMGQDNNYTQTDIEETARALTGWNGYFEFCDDIEFLPLLHDTNDKTIFGETGNWGYDDVINILFEQRQMEISTFICDKLYRNFVHPDGSEEIVTELAATFRDNNWELAPVFRQMFKSEHFFDDYIIGTLVKNPADFVIGMFKPCNFETNDGLLEISAYLIYGLGQELFNPVDVAGWPGNRTWINGTTLTGRWQSADLVLGTLFQELPQTLVDFAWTLAGDATDPAFVTQKIIDHLVPNGLNTPDAYDTATEVFKWEVPQNYYDLELWNLNWETAPAQVALLLQHLSRLPEFQLQ
ncbi:MAG: DUF1800 domain-containing protein [Bacteroidetes bacterium]|nr:MAG: DUF1800 domain-containing protein [Bacteroidota bacterium]